MQRIACSAVLACSFFALNAGAQTVKPGLWEVTNKMKSGTDEMEKKRAEIERAMASVHPELRKIFDDMTAKRGVVIIASVPGAVTFNVCITQEMIDNNELSDPTGYCKSTSSPRVGNLIKVTYVCTRPPSSGEVQISLAGTEAFNSKLTEVSTASGESEKMMLEGYGKWLSAECGAIRPMTKPKN